jgi:hypothetical protein
MTKTERLLDTFCFQKHLLHFIKKRFQINVCWVCIGSSWSLQVFQVTVLQKAPIWCYFIFTDKWAVNITENATLTDVTNKKTHTKSLGNQDQSISSSLTIYTCPVFPPWHTVSGGTTRPLGWHCWTPDTPTAGLSTNRRNFPEPELTIQSPPTT